MTKTSKYLFYLLAAILLSRLISMFLVPLTDTTEARYAEMARIMAQTGDYITPYIDYNIPFWGKPPLSFWAQALYIDCFGAHEFVPRFPSWLAELATIVLIFKLLVTVANRQTALWGSLIYASTLLAYALMGAVLTDPFLNLGLTLCFVAFIMVLKDQGAYWGYLFFIGLSIGLLAKGPLVLVIAGGTIGLWLLFSTKRWRVFGMYPWVGGVTLMLVLSLPWYIMAELKTPGFLNYFILGEHFYRFVDPGWAGDLYGSAHKRALGTIWLHFLAASFPWGLIALAFILKHLSTSKPLHLVRETFTEEEHSFYLIWALFPMLFFTFSGNVLWTYVLPALPALAILLALYLGQDEQPLTAQYPKTFIATALFIPLLATGAVLFLYKDDYRLPTEKYLVQHYESLSEGKKPLYCLGEKKFSVRYYTHGTAKEIAQEQLNAMLAQQQEGFYLSVPNATLTHIHQLDRIKADNLYQNKRFTLLEVMPKEMK